MVELNLAVALEMAYGPAVVLVLVDQLVDEPALNELLGKLGAGKQDLAR